MEMFFEQGHSDFFISRGEDLSFPSHFQGVLELVYCSEGSLVTTEGGKVYILYPGDLLVIFPNREHSYKSENFNKHIMLILNPAWCGMNMDVFTNYFPLSPVIRSNDLPQIWPSVFEDMLKEYNSDDEKALEICRSYSLIITMQLLRILKFQNNSFTELPLVNSVIAYCLNNYHSKITLNDLAKAVGVNKYHVSRIFSNRLGTTFCDYINSLRLNSAIIKLAKTKDPVTKIAFDCGFNSTRTFTRVFIKHMGMSPIKYRKQNTPSKTGNSKRTIRKNAE